jgi:hypothetical protein
MQNTVTQKTLKRKLNKQNSYDSWTTDRVKDMLTTDTNERIIYDTLVLVTSGSAANCYCIVDVNGYLTALVQMVHLVPNAHCVVHKFKSKHTQIGMLETALADPLFAKYTKPLAVTIAKHTIALDKHKAKKEKRLAAKAPL